MEIILTDHARKQMEARGVEENHIITAIKRGSTTKQTDGCLAVYGCVAVAYKIIGKDKYKIKTVIII